MRRRPTIIRILFLGILLAGAPGFLRAATQSFELESQWNLITFQVVPDNPDPQVVFASLPGFQAAWTYDASLAIWLRYTKTSGTTNDDDTANALLSLPPIQ